MFRHPGERRNQCTIRKARYCFDHVARLNVPFQNCEKSELGGGVMEQHAISQFDNSPSVPSASVVSS